MGRLRLERQSLGHIRLAGLGERLVDDRAAGTIDDDALGQPLASLFPVQTFGGAQGVSVIVVVVVVMAKSWLSGSLSRVAKCNDAR